MEIDRRVFLKSCVAGAGTVLAAGCSQAGLTIKPHPGGKVAMQKRKLGKTGQQLSIIGFGGMVINGAQPEHVAKIVAESIEKGINHFDVAPTYGQAEERLLPARRPGVEGQALPAVFEGLAV